MRLVFDMYDFDGDGQICEEDVRLMLSYIPLSKLNSGLNCLSTEKRSPINILSEDERDQHTKSIYKFVKDTFANQNEMTFSDFVEFNTNVSSQMFVSVISAIHAKLPCSQFIFK